MERVRQASSDDLDRIGELVTDFAADRAARRGADLTRPADGSGVPPDPTGASLAPYVSDPTRMALVGTLDDWVAAVALCRVHDGGGDRRGVLDVCFVEPGAREVGLGHLLLERSLEWFAAQRCHGVDGTAFPGDRMAKNFFESAGFKARLLVMHLPIDLQND
jgi:GNAT superfamily N-acetyltransferase